MKRYLYSLLIAIGLLVPAIGLAAPSAAGATDIFNGICTGNNDTNTSAAASDLCKEKQASDANQQNPVVHAIAITIEILSFIIGFASVVIIIISGFKMVTSRGDAQNVATARSAIIYAVIGVAISLLAATIVAVVLNNL